jgi:hypothetical protein
MTTELSYKKGTQRNWERNETQEAGGERI